MTLSRASILAFGQLKTAPIVDYLEKEGRSFEATYEAFRDAMLLLKTSADTPIRNEYLCFYDSLTADFRRKGLDGLVTRIKYGFYDFVSSLRFTKQDLANQAALADLRYPAEWYPATRRIQRVIHLHVGPTNSGKTYHALKALERAETGIYAGPLRLLAHEVYSRLNAKGKACALITGEERKAPDLANSPAEFSLISCTVEMVDLSKVVDVAVIDEIQMLGDEDRGWAWTQALLGVQAREVHLCGETRTVPLVRELCAMSGDKLIVHEYERLSPLEMDKESLGGDLRKLRKGDCVVSFSVMGIHAMRKAIEDRTGKKVAIVYGGLPPETRAQQARLFNDPDNEYDYLVASDAIGMGLNLSIKRIIFETTVKYDGYADRVIDTANIKQIAGRAGRYKTALDGAGASLKDEDLSAAKGETALDVNVISESAESKSLQQSIVRAPNVPRPFPSPYEATMKNSPGRPPRSTDPSSTGLVTTLQIYDYRTVEKALLREPKPIRTSGLLPPPNILDRFAQYFPPGTPFSYVLMRLNEMSSLHRSFHICGLRDALWIADIIEPVKNLSIPDRMIFANAPASFSDRALFTDLLAELARAVENQSGGALYEVRAIPLELLEEGVVMTRQFLRSLESLHKALVVYLWLSFRFFGIFNTRELAAEVKRRVEIRIETVLEGLSLEGRRQERLEKRRQARHKSVDDHDDDDMHVVDRATPARDHERIHDGVAHFTRSVTA